MDKYKLQFQKNGLHLDFAVRCEERFSAINKNCFVLAISSGTDSADHMRKCQEIRFFSEPMGIDEIVEYIINNPHKFPPEIAYCKGIVLEDDGQETINFQNKIDIKNKKKINETKGPPN